MRGFMSANAHHIRTPSGNARSMFEHVDRRGQVSLLPLTKEAQRFLAADVSANRMGAKPATIPCVSETGADPVRRVRTALTVRELQVFDLLISGLSSKRIAHELLISPRTVEVHRARLMQKMGVRNAAGLIRMALSAA
jgi:DNA-binding NarL/FixJ family response regulator